MTVWVSLDVISISPCADDHPGHSRSRRSVMRPLPATDTHPLSRSPQILACRSIAARRAGGFLQASLSKVPRHQHRCTTDRHRAEALPMNASDFSLPMGVEAPDFR